MNLHYTVTEEDYVRFNVQHILNSSQGRKAMISQKILAPLVIALAAFLAVQMTSLSPYLVSVVAIVAAVAWFLFYPKRFKKSISKQVRKYFLTGKNNKAIGKREMILTDSEIRELSDDGNLRKKWSEIVDFQEDDETFYIYSSPSKALIVPKRDLEDPDEVKAFIKNKMNA